MICCCFWDTLPRDCV